ncbi:hypothetical protein A5784_05915 [Mycobacterium sp. 852013-50091_SCH5140682]|uniref:hypothetical protein n=1 Tax=Mycobacterium sp. 852013-50091_SCH5140682 TaxID=1834109 RepID=UPI0007EB3546|nr:hypothetical protein [Mycobacterium sp. 852013-50091_SCH5140682]OBC08925.1 hypothetical protein A5784_05915 [Mycobacterium sp. 852013-50091_SCH5140682]
MNPSDHGPDEMATSPVMFNFRLETLSALVPNEKLVQWESLLRERIGAQRMAPLQASGGYSGGTVSMCDLNGDGWINIATEGCDCDYMA